MAISATVVIALIALAGAYGYHRDEAYFLAAGEQLSFGHPDQGPLTPALAALMSTIAPGSLTVLRIPAALATGAVVFLTGIFTPLAVCAGPLEPWGRLWPKLQRLG